MREKAAQGMFPGLAPFGYRNNKAERTIEIDPVDSKIVLMMFERYVTGTYTLSTLTKAIRSEFGKTISRANVHRILKNRFYVGAFEWAGVIYVGTHPLYVAPAMFAEVQNVLSGHNRPKYSKRNVAFRGLMRCANDGCLLTGDIQKEKYVYYPCTGYRASAIFRDSERKISPCGLASRSKASKCRRKSSRRSSQRCVRMSGTLAQRCKPNAHG